MGRRLVRHYGNAFTATLIEHWDGTGWRVIPSPNRLTTPNRNTINALNGMTAVAPDDIWAVGYSVSLDEPYQTLILHWKGDAWSIVDSPNSTGPYNALNAVAPAGPDDIWAAGAISSDCGPVLRDRTPARTAG